MIDVKLEIKKDIKHNLSRLESLIVKISKLARGSSSLEAEKLFDVYSEIFLARDCLLKSILKIQHELLGEKNGK